MTASAKEDKQAAEQALWDQPDKLAACLSSMDAEFRADPMKAVRSQSFIRFLHAYLAEDLRERLSPFARRRGVDVKLEPKVLGSHRAKDLDVGVIDPVNGPLMLIGVRSQMSSIGNNTLGYIDGIIGEAESLEKRFPMSTHGYVYFMPKLVIKPEKTDEKVTHARWAGLLSTITGRHGVDYNETRGVYDHLAYMVVDFHADPLTIDDKLVADAVPDIDLRIGSFLDRMVETYKDRNPEWAIFS
jgi:hypothetical protein